MFHLDLLLLIYTYLFPSSFFYYIILFAFLNSSSEGAPVVAEQLKTVAEKFEEYFNPTESQESAKAPQFGAKVEGSMPTGNKNPSFGDYWGFGKMKGE